MEKMTDLKLAVRLSLFALVALSGKAFLKAESNALEELRHIKIAAPEGDKKSQADIIAIEIDSEIFGATQRNCSDIRLTNGSKREIPYYLRRQLKEGRTEKILSERRSKILSLKKLKGNSVEIILEKTDDRSAPDCARINTPNKDFEKRAALFGSDDKKAWRLLEDGIGIFDNSQVIDLSNRDIKFPASNCKYYKIVISNFAEDKLSPFTELAREIRHGKPFAAIEKSSSRRQSFRIDGIALYASEERRIFSENATKEYPAKVEGVSVKDKNSVIVIETEKQPLTSFAIETDSENFLRRARLECSDNGKDWKTLVCDTEIYSIKVSGFQKKQDRISFTETRCKHYRLFIRNGDAAPISNPSVKAFGNIYRIETLWEKDLKELKLFYGGNVQAPQYNIQKIASRIKDPKTALWKLGPSCQNPEFKPQGFLETAKYKPLFIVVVTLMIIALGWMLAKNIKKIDSSEK